MDHAATWLGFVFSIPSLNLTPVMTFEEGFKVMHFHQFFSAHGPNLNIIYGMPSQERHPLEDLVRCRNVANIDSIALMVRVPCQFCVAKSRNAPRSSWYFCKHSVALGVWVHKVLGANRMPFLYQLWSQYFRFCVWQLWPLASIV